MNEPANISDKFNFTSHYVEVNGSKMHYIEQGSGDAIVFVHGMPTYSYLWRNIIPTLSEYGRAIAVDLVGMGLSAKPDIEYTLQDHISYFTGFMEAMKLKNVTLVLHGWGSLIGFYYASRHPANIKALAFYESHVRPTTDWDMLSLPVQQLATLLQRPGAAYKAIIEQNYLVKKLLPSSVLRKLTPTEMAYYEKPFPNQDSRKLLWQYIQELPLGKNPDSMVVELIKTYSRWLQSTDIPKLMLYAVPGFITTIATVQWAKDHLPNLTLAELPDALHFAQETIPHEFADKLTAWYRNV